LHRVFTSGILYAEDGSGLAGPDGAIPPVNPPFGAYGAFFHKDNSTLNRKIDPDRPRICVDTKDIVYFDREERFSRDVAVESPGEPGTLSFCGETTVMRIGTRPVLGSVISTQTVRPPISNPVFTEGWAWIGVHNTTTINGGRVDNGLPIIGYAAIRARNTSVTPVTNYGYTWPHRYNLD